MRPGRDAGRAGFALLPVVLALSLLAATAYLMTRESAMGSSLLGSTQRQDRARYLAEAALRHADWQVQAENCGSYSDVPTTNLGNATYSATVTPASGSPFMVSATGTLADGTTQTIDRTGLVAYETPATLSLQLGTDPGRDVLIDSFWPIRNHGASTYLRVSADPSWTLHSLLQFDLPSIPTGAMILSARLELRMWSLQAAGVATVHRVTRDWVEGTMNGGGQANGATWQTHDGASAWSTPGGEFAPEPLAETSIQPGDTWVAWEIAPLVRQWVDGVPNHGLVLKGAPGLGRAEFASLDTNGLADRPKLTIVYACECGQVCGGGGGTRVLYVVEDPGGLSTQESARETLMQGWGFSVTRIDDDDTQANFDTEAADHDAAYVSQEALEGSLGTKLVDATIGVVNESRDTIDVFGFATSANAGGGLPTLKVDPSHFITSVFPTETVAPYGVNEWYQIASTPVAAGVQPVGVWVESPWTDLPALMALDVGADLLGGGTAAGRRVQIPMGAGQGLAPVDVNGLSDDGRTIIKRSIQWAGGAGCGSLKPLLLVVSDSGNPPPQEAARQTLLESWCYEVTRIDDDATSGELAAAMALNDVIYISQEITTLTTVAKLKDADIGVVNEEYLISSDLGLGSGTGTGFYNDINLVDDTHYITSESGLGALALFTPSYDIYTGTGFTLAPDLHVLGVAGSITGLAALDTGGALWDSGTAAGRRVLVPWGDDFAALNSDGQTLMRRAVEWAAGAGCGSPQQVLLVVGDDTLPLASRDAGRVELIESGCFTVSVIDDGDTQTNFDTAVDAADVVYVSGTSSGPALLDKLTGITKGVVNEVAGKLDNFGFSSSTSQTLSADTFAKSDPAHYITAPFGGDPIGVFTQSLLMPVPGGTLAPGLQVPAGVTASEPAVVTLDTGAQRWDGNPAPARRVHLPFAPAETTQLTADGETIVQRSIQWAAGAAGGGPPPAGVVFEEFSEAKANAASSLSIDKPAGTAAGDLLIASLVTDGSTSGSMSPPAGWNVVDLAEQGAAVTFGVWWKLAGASEAASYSFSWSDGEKVYGTVMRFTGHDPVSPVHASATDGGSSSAPASPAVTTTVPDTMILRLGGFDDDDITVDAPGLAGHTAITMDKSSQGNGTSSSGAGYLTQAAAGDSGTSTFSLTQTEEARTVTLAIAPDPS